MTKWDNQMIKTIEMIMVTRRRCGVMGMIKVIRMITVTRLRSEIMGIINAIKMITDADVT